LNPGKRKETEEKERKGRKGKARIIEVGKNFVRKDLMYYEFLSYFMGRLVEAATNIFLLIFAILFVKICLSIMPEITIFP